MKTNTYIICVYHENVEIVKTTFISKYSHPCFMYNFLSKMRIKFCHLVA